LYLLSNNVNIGIYKPVIFHVVLYGSETWSLTSREVHRLRVFENSVLKRIFGRKRDEVTGGWRKLYNEKLHNLKTSRRWMQRARLVAQMGKNRNAYRILVGKRGKKWTTKKTKT
jgi:hypothetical protein